MYCSSCGSQIPDDSVFCGNCGAQVSQVTSADTEGRPPRPPAAEYLPPGQPPTRPPGRPDRTTLWIALSATVVILAAAGIAIPLLVRAAGADETTSTTASATTVTTVVSTTTVSPVTTAPPSTAAETTTTSAPEPVDQWVEVDIPGGPWAAYAVAISEEAVLLSTSSGPGSRLIAVILGSGDIIELAEADAQWGMDVDGGVAVWWEGNDWDDGTQKWSDQHIYSFRLPDGPRQEISAGSGRTMSLPQVALPYVTWVESEPWADAPDEYEAKRILMTRLDDGGVPVGPISTIVPLALANILGDSGWDYSLSPTVLAWQHATAAGGVERGTHVLEIDTESHGHIGADAWWPSLWQHTLVFSQDGLKYTDLSAGGVHDFTNGDYPAAGPDFAAFYRMASGGTEIVARSYDGTHEQVLGLNPDPPWFCPPISVSQTHIAFTVGTEVHLFEWR